MSDEKPAIGTQEITGNFEQLRQMYAFDTDRHWANAVQIFYEDNPATVLLVFRETINAKPVKEDGTPGEDQQLLGKNVTSIVLPIETAQSLGDILVDHLNKFKDV